MKSPREVVARFIAGDRGGQDPRAFAEGARRGAAAPPGTGEGIGHLPINIAPTQRPKPPNPAARGLPRRR